MIVDGMDGLALEARYWCISFGSIHDIMVVSLHKRLKDMGSFRLCSLRIYVSGNA